MKSNDSYPPAERLNNDEKEIIPENTSSQEDSGVPSASGQEDDDDGRSPQEWDGNEAEVVLDEKNDDYKKESTGVKINFFLKFYEIKKFIKHSEGYRKSRTSQKKHTAVQCFVFLAMILMSTIVHNDLYLWLSVIPIAALLIIWIVPFFGVKKLMHEMFNREEFVVEVFSDKIDVRVADEKRAIPLDGSCEVEEYDNLILLFAKDGLSLIIPIRAIEPEFQAEVQAMIFAGTRSKNEK